MLPHDSEEIVSCLDIMPFFFQIQVIRLREFAVIPSPSSQCNKSYFPCARLNLLVIITHVQPAGSTERPTGEAKSTTQRI